MGQAGGSERAYVIYRAVGRAGRPVEVHLVAAARVATVADAWARLSRIDPGIDPRSLEIETRRLPRRFRLAGSVGRPSAPPVDLARWVAARAAMAHHAGG